MRSLAQAVRAAKRDRWLRALRHELLASGADASPEVLDWWAALTPTQRTLIRAGLSERTDD